MKLLRGTDGVRQYMMKSCESLKGGLSKIAQTLEVRVCLAPH